MTCGKSKITRYRLRGGEKKGLIINSSTLSEITRARQEDGHENCLPFYPVSTVT